jgi:transcriptional regulator with XRE-family HTH domain
MPKMRFGDILRNARIQQGISLRQLAAESGVDYSRLSRMEHGMRPAPGLRAIRRLAELLSLNLVDLLVSVGMPREAVEQMLWAERLQQAKRAETLAQYAPHESRASLRNEFVVEVVSREGAGCTAKLGSLTWTLVAFSDAERFRVMIPPESIHVFANDPHEFLAASYNVFRARIRKIRAIGALLNLILVVGDIELNALVMGTKDTAPTLHPDAEIYVAISPVAISSETQ